MHTGPLTRALVTSLLPLLHSGSHTLSFLMKVKDYISLAQSQPNASWSLFSGYMSQRYRNSVYIASLYVEKEEIGTYILVLYVRKLWKSLKNSSTG